MPSRFSTVHVLCCCAAVATALYCEVARAESNGEQTDPKVTGIFDGFNVGGTTKHTAKPVAYKPAPTARRSRSGDSFAVQPGTPGTDTAPAEAKSNHPKQDIIPPVDGPVGRSVVPVRQATTPTVTVPADENGQSLPPSREKISAAYYQSLANQVKGGGPNGAPPQGQSKHVVTDANRF